MVNKFPIENIIGITLEPKVDPGNLILLDKLTSLSTGADSISDMLWENHCFLTRSSLSFLRGLFSL